MKSAGVNFKMAAREIKRPAKNFLFLVKQNKPSSVIKKTVMFICAMARLSTKSAAAKTRKGTFEISFLEMPRILKRSWKQRAKRRIFQAFHKKAASGRGNTANGIKKTAAKGG